MSNSIATTQQKPIGAIGTLAAQFNMEAGALAETLKRTVFPGGSATNEQLAAFAVVCNTYGLNPFTKQIYAFPAKGGGVVPMVSIDGWLSIVNSHPQMNGMNFRYEKDDAGNVFGITCIIHRKDRSHPTVVTEFLDECKMATQPWAKKPMTMLRHRAIIQCARIAFSFSGIVSEEDAEVILQAEIVDSGVAKPRTLADLTNRPASKAEPHPEPVDGFVGEAPVSMSAEESAELDRQAAASESQREAVEFFGKPAAQPKSRRAQRDGEDH